MSINYKMLLFNGNNKKHNIQIFSFILWSYSAFNLFFIGYALRVGVKWHGNKFK